MDIFKNSNVDFLRWRWHAIALSAVVIAAGLGTIVIMEFEQQPELQRVREALNNAFGGQSVVVNQYGDPDRRQLMVRVPQTGAESGAELSAPAQLVEKAVTQANVG